MITEAQFIAYEDGRLAEISRSIRESGCSLYEIAKACKLSWETVQAAANAVAVKFSTLCRIQLDLETKRNNKS